MAGARKTKDCTTCASHIPLNSNYCTKCESYQNWRRHLQFGVYTLPMLVALFAVVVPIIPVTGQWLFGNNSRLATSSLRFSPSAVEVTVSNLGDRPGVVDDVTFQLARLDDPENPLMRWVAPHVIRFVNADSPVVPPSEVRKFRFLLAPEQNDAADTALVQKFYGSVLNEASCSFVVSTAEFRGEQNVIYKEVPCLQTWRTVFPSSASLFDAGIDEILNRWLRSTTGNTGGLEGD
ncbi:hypothetical protein [Devosia sp.]|uniref:hypothetical protein n=1 Tax=Devosia sp. TaxID=1871048 RepID=UPI00292CC276|nr:hypothetical protein [Devosia sp.]